MQVILLHDVERVGHEGDIMKVAGGYARNYLLPRGLAVLATKGALGDLELRRSAITKRDTDKRDKAAALCAHLSEQQLEVRATVGEGRRLHGQVTTQMIADAVKAQLEFEIDRRDIEITEPIRELGDYLLSVRIYKDVRAQLPVRVVPGGKHYDASALPQAPASVDPQDAVDSAEEILWDADEAAKNASQA